MAAAKKVRVGLYARVSKADKDDPSSVPVQLADCRDRAAEEGWDVVAEYTDHGISAWNPSRKRPEFERLLADVEAEFIDTVLVREQERLDRGHHRLRHAPRLFFLLFLLSLVVLMAGGLQPTAVASPGVIGWVVECDFVRHRSDDPIVLPGQPGASHLHAFYGNRRVHAGSTYRSLLASATSCALAADKGAYWTPAAYVGGELIEPMDADFYYRVLTKPSAVRPFPRNLRIVAGDAHATSPQSKRIVDWDCENGGDSTDRDRPPTCDSGIVSARIKFPDCWDGRRLDSANHKRHMAYSIDGPGSWQVCPKTHPVPVPKLLFKLEWPVHDGTGLTLSSGSAVTMHGDFINSWKQRRLARMVKRCLNGSINCGAFNTPN